MKNCLSLWRKIESNQEDIDKYLESYNLSSTAQDIYVYIGAFHYTCIAIIREAKYFKNKSFSTIKRAILELKNHDLIHALPSQDDKRIVWLTHNPDKE